MRYLTLCYRVTALRRISRESVELNPPSFIDKEGQDAVIAANIIPARKWHYVITQSAQCSSIVTSVESRQHLQYQTFYNRSLVDIRVNRDLRYQYC